MEKGPVNNNLTQPANELPEEENEVVDDVSLDVLSLVEDLSSSALAPDVPTSAEAAAGRGFFSGYHSTLTHQLLDMFCVLTRCFKLFPQVRNVALASFVCNFAIQNALLAVITLSTTFV